jgi:drug/metabolite transporter (DMT)-like permease
MSTFAIFLIIISAVLHAGWNLVSKKEIPTTAYFFLAHFFGSLLFLPMVFIHWQNYAFFPIQVWVCAALSGIFLTIYLSSLAKAFRSGDLSIAYPLIRAIPIVLVTIFSFMIGSGDKISLQCLNGIFLIIIGCFLLPMTQIRKFRIQHYINTTIGFALLAAAGTAGYNIADDQALQYLRAESQINLSNFELTILYFFAEAACASICLLTFILTKKSRREDLWQKIRFKKKNTALMGLAIYITYTLALISLAYVNNVSYVVAFRQLSIPLAAILGIILLKESYYRPKIIGIVILMTGLFFVGTG